MMTDNEAKEIRRAVNILQHLEANVAAGHIDAFETRLAIVEARQALQVLVEERARE